MPNSEISLPEKDSETLNYELMPIFMLDSPCPDSQDQEREKEALDREQEEDEEHQSQVDLDKQELQEQDFGEKGKEGGNKFERSTFDIQIICYGDNHWKIGEDCRTTPASFDVDLRETKGKRCPTAPRKPKTAPSRKRSWGGRSVLLDVSKEVDSMFPPEILEGFGKKIKKARS